jgi:hypothetical protein
MTKNKFLRFNTQFGVIEVCKQPVEVQRKGSLVKVDCYL